MKLSLLLLVSLLSGSAYAGERHHHNPSPEPTPINVPDDGSNHNAIAIAAVIGIGICVYYKCWKPKPVKDGSNLVPEPLRNEYTYTIKP